MKSSHLFLFPALFLLLSCTVSEQPPESTELIWIEVASGERQCIPPTYASLEDAINQLTSFGIDVFESTTISFPVCAACSCPTGTIYQAEIQLSDLKLAEKLGWLETDSGDN